MWASIEPRLESASGQLPLVQGRFQSMRQNNARMVMEAQLVPRRASPGRLARERLEWAQDHSDGKLIHRSDNAAGRLLAEQLHEFDNREREHMNALLTNAARQRVRPGSQNEQLEFSHSEDRPPLENISKHSPESDHHVDAHKSQSPSRYGSWEQDNTVNVSSHEYDPIGLVYPKSLSPQPDMLPSGDGLVQFSGSESGDVGEEFSLDQEDNSLPEELRANSYSLVDHEPSLFSLQSVEIAPTLGAAQPSPRFVSQSQDSDSLFQASTDSDPPLDMSATAYAMGHYGRDSSEDKSYPHLSLPTPTESAISSMKSQSSSGRATWSDETSLTPSPTNPLRNFHKIRIPRFLSEQDSLDIQIRYMTLRVALTRCSVLVGKSEFPEEPDSPLDPTNRTKDSKPNSNIIKALTIAKHVCMPQAQYLESEPLEGRCWYWVGRAETGKKSWAAAREAFEKAIKLGVESCRHRPESEGKDVRFWLGQVKRKENRMNKGRIGTLRLAMNASDLADAAAGKVRAEFSPYHLPHRSPFRPRTDAEKRYIDAGVPKPPERISDFWPESEEEDSEPEVEEHQRSPA
ncbi:hypothetical protein K469DRAFT_292681 [Zopfia rhizophila CBS 207.26]|uniref:Uncharacterized protein n=1 Tax=Zopfia rhizophila CBS 207.26 TaxID=1314779 RepID=A0A6A6DKG1_9PEZI|nr:hypothetical protein K469DRAFT_292681 [Zopfia rhizophila CBS 207.26]